MSDSRIPPTCGGHPMDYNVLTRMWECECGRDVADESCESAIAWAAFEHVGAEYATPDMLNAISSMANTLTLAFEDDCIALFANLSYPERNPAIARQRARRASQRPLGQCRDDWFQVPRRERRRIVLDRYHQRTPIASIASSIDEAEALRQTNAAWDACDPSLFVDVEPSPIVFILAP